MEANEAPENIYIACDVITEEGRAFILEKPVSCLKSVEYIRTDAFIEKAVDWWMDNFVYTDDVDIKYKTIQNFKNYLKGEMYEKDYTKGRR